MTCSFKQRDPLALLGQTVRQCHSEHTTAHDPQCSALEGIHRVSRWIRPRIHQDGGVNSLTLALESSTSVGKQGMKQR
jgi:hypothetical protein